MSHKLRKMLLLIARLSTSLSFFSSLILVPWLLIIKIALLRCCCGLFVYSNEHLMANSKLVRCHIHTHAHTHRGKAKENRERASKKVRGREIQIGLTCSDFPFRFCTSPFSLIWFLLHFSQFIFNVCCLFFSFLLFPCRFSFINYGEILEIVRLLSLAIFTGKSPPFMAHPLYLSLWELRIICAC